MISSAGRGRRAGGHLNSEVSEGEPVHIRRRGFVLHRDKVRPIGTRSNRRAQDGIPRGDVQICRMDTSTEGADRQHKSNGMAFCALIRVSAQSGTSNVGLR